MCNCCAHKCFITLSAIAASGNIQFPDSARIRDGRITSVNVRRSGAATLKNESQQVLVPDTVVNTAYLVVKNKNGTEIFKGPLSMLQRDYNAPEPLRVNWQGVDPTQSNIIFDTTAAGYAATQVFEITFGLDCDDCYLPG